MTSMTAVQAVTETRRRDAEAVARWLFAVAALVALMVVIGGLTRLTESGLSMVEWKPITGWLQLKDLEGAIAVTAQALDGAARPIGPEIRGKMIEPGWEIAVGATAATTYLIRVER